MYLYYLKDNQSLKLEDNPDYILDGTDHWCQFNITHNSTFLLSGSKLNTSAPVPAVEATASGMKISWNQAPNAKKYVIYKSTNGKKYSVLKTISKASTTYCTDSKAKVNGSKYFYKVKTTLKSGSKTKTVTSKAVTSYFLSQPKISKASSVKGGKVNVSWSKNAKASGYEVQCKAGSQTKVITISKKATAKKTISKLTKGVTYKVQVRAYKKSGKTKYYSAWSKAKTVKTR